ncbi:MAG: RluA family pseudouridine synthase [Granulosicoccaceae bacterium]|jgi:tRNA pseudouridine32 synthase/23S rRNA pseudouridine746 synthase
MILPATHFEQHLSIDIPGRTAVEWLAEHTPLSKQRIKMVMHNGAVWLTHGKQTRRLRRASKPLQNGDTLHLYYDSKILDAGPVPAELISDEGAYSIWFKPSGMFSQGSKWGDHCTVYRWAEQHLTPQRPAFIVHRLDRAASGLIIIAHEKRIAAALADKFRARKVEKHYHVITHGCFPAQDMTLDSDVDNKPAVSHVQRQAYDVDTDRSLLDVRIDTGRKHQIRRHLSEAGYPVVGDRQYGNKTDKQDLQLCAVSLAFTCPVTQHPVQFLLPEEKIPVL